MSGSVEQALRALEDRSFRTGSPADASALARIADKHGLDAQEAATLRLVARQAGLLDEQQDELTSPPVEGAQERGTATAEWVELKQLFADARRYKLLDAAQEKSLARRYQQGERARQRLEQPPVPSAAVRAELIVQVEDGKLAKDTFVCCNLRLVASIARNFRGQGLDIGDLVQEGILGLIRAVEKFDHTLDYKFSTYATWWIRQAIQRAIANTGRTIRLPVHVHDLVRKIIAVERRLCWELEHEPTVHDIARRIDEDPGLVAFVMEASRGISSLDQRLGEGPDAGTLVDFIASGEPPVESEVLREVERDEIRALLQDLGPRPREVIERRYGIGSDRPETLEEIGVSLGVTRERIRQIETQAKKELAVMMRPWTATVAVPLPRGAAAGTMRIVQPTEADR